MKVELLSDGNKSLVRMLENLPKQERFATMKALNGSIAEAHHALKEKVKKSFDNPTRWFINATGIRYAKKTNLKAEIGPKDVFGYATGGVKVESYFYVHVFGGKRKDKRSETLLKQMGAFPRDKQLVMARFGIRKNRHGNITGGMMNRILSGLRAQLDYHQNSPFDSANYNRWFYGEIKGVRGIWEQKGKRTRLWLKETDHGVYKKRLPYFETINDSVDANFDMLHRRWLEHALKTAR